MLLKKIRNWLTAEGVPFREVHHEPTRTSEDSARARGEELRVGGKALLIKVDAVFRLFVLSPPFFFTVTSTVNVGSRNAARRTAVSARHQILQAPPPAEKNLWADDSAQQ